MLRGALTNANGRPQTSPWVVFLAHKQYLDHHFEEQPLECELQSDDIVDAKQYKMVKVKGLTAEWARKNNNREWCDYSLCSKLGDRRRCE